MQNKPISRKGNIVVQDLENEVLIYDLSINKAFCLNETSSLVYQLCDGKRTVGEISELMSKELKTKVPKDLVWLALRELTRENLLENADQLTNHLVGMSRREVVKKIGLASMIALPIIASVVAPNAAMAQSLLKANLSACTLDTECQSGNCTDIGMSCCNPTANSTTTAAQQFFVTGGQTDCNNNFSTLCCSATSATFTQSPASPTGTGICNCNP